MYLAVFGVVFVESFGVLAPGHAIGAATWVALWTSAGYLAGDHLPQIYAELRRYQLYLLIAVALVARWWIRRRRRDGVSEPTAHTAGGAPGSRSR